MHIPCAKVNLQFCAMESLCRKGVRSINVEADRLCRRPNSSKPHHDFVRGISTVLRLLLIAVHEHIHSDVGVEQVLLHCGEICLCSLRSALCGTVAKSVCPLKVDLDLVNGVELGGEDVAVDFDVGEGVDRSGFGALGIFPYYRPSRSGCFCCVRFIIIDVDLRWSVSGGRAWCRMMP